MSDDRLPWFHCYPSKLLGALAGMSPDEKLTYVVVLLRIYEVRGALHETLDSLSRRIGINKRRVTEALDALYRAGKLTNQDGGILNPYAAEKLAEGEAKYAKRARAGAAGGSAAAKKRQLNQTTPGSNATALGKQEDLDSEKKVRPFPRGNGAKRADEEPGLFPCQPSSTAPEPVDERTRLWREGTSSLQGITGKMEGQCKAMIGRWLRQARDDTVLVRRAIEDAVRDRPFDPIPWIQRAIEARSNPGSRRGGNGFVQAHRELQEMFKQEEDQHGYRTENDACDDVGVVPAIENRR